MWKVWCSVFRWNRKICKGKVHEHQRPSLTASQVAKHIHVNHPQHTVELESIETLTTEPKWFESRVKEFIYIRTLKPNLNREGRRYNLPLVWGNIIKKKVKADRSRRRVGYGGPSHHRFTQPRHQQAHQAIQHFDYFEAIQCKIVTLFISSSKFVFFCSHSTLISLLLVCSLYRA